MPQHDERPEAVTPTSLRSIGQALPPNIGFSIMNFPAMYSVALSQAAVHEYTQRVNAALEELGRAAQRAGRVLGQSEAWASIAPMLNTKTTLRHLELAGLYIPEAPIDMERINGRLASRPAAWWCPKRWEARN